VISRRRLWPLIAWVLFVAACGNAGGDDAGTTTVPPSSSTTTSSTATTSTTVPTTTTAAAPPPIAEPIELPSTGVWVHLFDDTLKTPAGVEAMLDEVADAGIDAVFAQVARRHDAYYDSAYLPPTPDPALAPGFDVLQALTTGAHARGIQLHAWFVVAPGYHHQYGELTMPRGHVWLEHGPDSADPWMTVDSGGVTSRDYFDVGLPAVHDHVAAIIADIAGRYPIDGVHLDYVRYDGGRWGYHPDALEQFSLATGRQDHPSATDPHWVRWRQSRTADLAERARDTLNEVRPGALLSTAVIAGGPGPSSMPGGFADTRAASLMFQDWPMWLDEGLVDFVVAMAYTRQSNTEHAGWFREWVSFAGELSRRHPGRVGVGVGAYLNSVADGLTQVRLVRETTGFVAVYSYQQDSAGSERGALLAQCCR
jgi:uncharacterized lipoprotein YddW (UPF0748 family)